MIRWASKPSKAFEDLLKNIFEDMLHDDIAYPEIDYSEENKKYIEKNRKKLFSDELIHSPIHYTFPDNVVEQFGGYYKLLKEIWYIKRIHEEKKLYQISDYHYMLLYYMIESYVGYYNDTATTVDIPELSDFLIINSITKKPILELSFNMIESTYFWDLDFFPLSNDKVNHSKLKAELTTDKDMIELFDESEIKESPLVGPGSAYYEMYKDNPYANEYDEQHKNVICI